MNISSTSIIEAIPLREQVADIIRQMIVKGELQSESQISERVLSRVLNISTTPIKEALRSLQSEGLVYTVPRKGTFVSKVSKDSMLQIAFMRSALEGVAARFAVMYITDEEIGRMSDALKESERLISNGGSAKEIGHSNHLFHYILRSASHNSYLVNLINNMRSIDNTFRQVSLEADQYEPKRAHIEHLRILEVVEQRNEGLAEKVVATHIRRVAKFVAEKK